MSDLERRYAVFISYRHADNREPGRQWASWLHHTLESYEVPADLVGTPNLRGQPIPAGLYPVFRDEEELPADADLTQSIQRALERSELLVVICSPRAVASRFVGEEIRHFKESGRADRVLALMTDGEPNASDDPEKQRGGIAAEAECLPQPLRFGVPAADGRIDWTARTEPIAADVRPEGNPEPGWTSAAAYREALERRRGLPAREIHARVRAYEQRLELARLKVIAGALGVPLGVLTRRDQAMQLQRARARAAVLRRWLAAVAVLAAAAIAAGLYADRQRIRALQQTRIALAQDFSVQAEDALDKAPVRSALLAAEAVRATTAAGQPATRQALQSLHDSLAGIGGVGFSPASGSVMPGAVGLSPDSRWIAAGGSDGAATVWKTGAPGSPVATLRTGADPVNFVAFTPDLHHLVTAGDGGQACLWSWNGSPASAQPVRLAGGAQDGMVWGLSPNGRWLVETGQAVVVWDLNGAGPPAPAVLGQGRSTVVGAVAFTADSSALATADWDGQVQLWQLAPGQPPRLRSSFNVEPAGERERRVDAVAVSPDGNWLATAGADGDLRVRRLGDLRPSATSLVFELPYAGSFEDVGARMAISPDGAWIAAGAQTGPLLLWQLEHLAPAAKPVTLDDSAAGAVAIRFMPNGRFLAAAGNDGLFRLWGLSALPHAVYEVLRGHEGSGADFAFSANGRWLLTSGADGQARLWDVQQGNPSAEPAPAVSPPPRPKSGWSPPAPLPHGLAAGTAYAAVRPDATLWAAADPTGAVSLWQLKDGQPVLVHRLLAADKTGSPPTGGAAGWGGLLYVQMVASADGRWLAVFRQYTNAFLVDLRPGSGYAAVKLVRHDADSGQALVRGVFSPDGRWLAAASMDSHLWLWDLHNANPAAAAVLMNAKGELLALQGFSPDSAWLLALTYLPDRVGYTTPRLFDLTAPFPNTASLSLHPAPGRAYTAAAFGNGGRAVVAWAENGGAVDQWMLQPEDLLSLARVAAGRNFTADEWQAAMPGQAYRPTFPSLPVPSPPPSGPR